MSLSHKVFCFPPWPVPAPRGVPLLQMMTYSGPLLRYHLTLAVNIRANCWRSPSDGSTQMCSIFTAAFIFVLVFFLIPQNSEVFKKLTVGKFYSKTLHLLIFTSEILYMKRVLNHYV